MAYHRPGAADDRATRASRSKRQWLAPDHLRPLDAVGDQHAKALARVLGAYPVRRLVSSPARRCIQTLQPLADEVSRAIEIWDDLGPDAGPSSLISWLSNPDFADAVVCTHGEVMSPLLRLIDRRRVAMTGPDLDRRGLLTKGTAWHLVLASDGRIVGLHHVVPTA